MKRDLSVVILIVAIAALAVGIVRLFELRFDIGDVYPRYSSLRSDPIGTMAFYESLAALSGFQTRRDFSNPRHWPPRNTTYFHLAVPIEEWRGLSDTTYKEMEQFATGGGRLVITLLPVPVKAISSTDRTSAPPASGSPETEKPQPTPYRDRWAVNFDVINLEKSRDGVYEAASVKNGSRLPLPEALDWHSGIIVITTNPGWKTIYSRGTDPVVIERGFGAGTVVISTDSYLLSNEAMLRDRHPDLLTWLIGPNQSVIFDEAHLGVVENPGVATLMRRYRLHWLVASLIVLALLFVWKNSVSLLPPRSESPGVTAIAGKDATTGFINLLRRGVPERDLLTICFTEWEASAGRTPRYSASRIQAAKKSIGARDMVTAYREISKILCSK